MAGQQFRNRTIRVSVASGGHGGGHSTRSSSNSSSGGGGAERATETVLGAAALDQILDRVNPNVLRDAVDAVRRIDAASPERARALLADHPQLAYALARALQRLALVDDATAQQLVLAPAPAPYDPAFVPQQPQLVPVAPYGFVAPAAAPDVAAAMQHDPALQSMIQQLREVPLEEVMALPPETREQILHYRA